MGNCIDRGDRPTPTADAVETPFPVDAQPQPIETCELNPLSHKANTPDDRSGKPEKRVSVESLHRGKRTTFVSTVEAPWATLGVPPSSPPSSRCCPLTTSHSITSSFERNDSSLGAARNPLSSAQVNNRRISNELSDGLPESMCAEATKETPHPLRSLRKSNCLNNAAVDELRNAADSSSTSDDDSVVEVEDATTVEHADQLFFGPHRSAATGCGDGALTLRR